MKVCHMTSVHESTDDRIFLKECVSLAKAGYDTYQVAYGESFEKDGVKTIGLGKRASGRIKRILVSSRKVYQEALKIDADIYHVHDPELLPYAVKLKKRGKKVIFDSHEDIPRQILAKEWLPDVFRNIVSKLVESYQKKVSLELDCVITATPYIENIFREYGAKANVVHNYPILDDINVDNSDYYVRKDILCYAGGLTEQRGIRELISVSDDLDIELHLAGDISFDYKEELTKQLKCKKVIFDGILNRQQICDLYRKSKIGMALLHPTPNHVNALAIKLFEYMAAGLPIICSDFPLWKKIVEDNGCGICVNPFDKATLVEAIQFLVTNENKAKEMGDSGKRCVHEIYNWEKEEDRLLKIYSKL